jgi:hypothetical protein
LNPSKQGVLVRQAGWKRSSVVAAKVYSFQGGFAQKKLALRQIGMTRFGVRHLSESIGNRSLIYDLRFTIFEMGSA